MKEEGTGEGGGDAREPPGAGLRRARRVEQLRRRGSRFGVRCQRRVQRLCRSLLELGVLVEQQAVLATGLAQERGVVLRLARAPVERDQPHVSAARADRVGRTVVGGVVDDDHLVLELGRMRALDGVEAAHQELAPIGVHDAVGDHHIRNDRHSCGSSSSTRLHSRRRTTTRSRPRSRVLAWTSSS